jgi:chromosome segregation ATPase
MAGLFKNSLFGYKKEAVIGFVAESKEKIRAKDNEIAKLKKELDILNNKNQELEAKVVELTAVTEDFKAREEAITKLSESIGKLYLVAKSNADSIMTSALKTAEDSAETVQKNITAADSAYAEFTKLEEILSDNINRFSKEISSIKEKLQDVKEKAIENGEIFAEKSSKYDSVISAIDQAVSK